MTKVKVSALIAAAGSGTRLGSGPKAALHLGGQTLLAHTLGALSGLVDEVIVAVRAEQLAEFSAAHGEARFVAGAASRQGSVSRLVAAADRGLVLVHDVARPFLPADVVKRVLAAAGVHGAASAAVAVSDTIVFAAGTSYGEVLDRGNLRTIQTPQAFDRDLLADAHAAAAARDLTATDDAALVRASGRHVELVPGSRLLLKITEPGDLALAEALLPLWLARPQEPA